ncbi:hypothetical protein BDW72DRAFT_137309 [Aspergillus terricola var. indicus]
MVSAIYTGPSPEYLSLRVTASLGYRLDTEHPTSYSSPSRPHPQIRGPCCRSLPAANPLPDRARRTLARPGGVAGVLKHGEPPRLGPILSSYHAPTTEANS